MIKSRELKRRKRRNLEIFEIKNISIIKLK